MRDIELIWIILKMLNTGLDLLKPDVPFKRNVGLTLIFKLELFISYNFVVGTKLSARLAQFSMNLAAFPSKSSKQPG